MVTDNNTQSNTSESTDELPSMFAFVGRAGFLATRTCLIYGLAGVPLGNFVVPDSDDLFGGDRSKWELGYTGGAGLEHKFNKHWSIRAEYRFVHFEVDRDQSTSQQTTVQTNTTSTFENTSTRSSSTDVDFHLGKIGIVYGF